MKRSRLSLLSVFYLLFTVGSLSAQVNDAGLWMSLNLEKKLTSRLSAEFSEEIRMNENISEFGTILSEVGLQYRIHQKVSVSAGYRFTQKRRVDDSYSTRHRFLFNVNARDKFGKIAVGLRLRYQSQYSDINSSDDGKIPSNYLRTKLTAKYDLDSRFTPFLSFEAFCHVNNPEGLLYDNYRLAAGIEYEFNKKNSIDIGYMIDREVNVSNPWTNYVITLGYNYKL